MKSCVLINRIQSKLRCQIIATGKLDFVSILQNHATIDEPQFEITEYTEDECTSELKTLMSTKLEKILSNW